MSLNNLKRGDPVTYIPYEGCPESDYDHGIVKSVCEDGEHAFVLYHTAVKHYEVHDLNHYTAVRTRIKDLIL